MNLYSLRLKGSTKFYTSSNPDTIENALTSYPSLKPGSLKIDEKRYKVKFNLRTIDSENQITMKILEIDSETRCIEFVNQNGYLLDFHSHI